MQVLTSFRHMDASPAFRQTAEEKLQRVIRKYIRDNFDAQVTCSVEKFRHQVDILLSYKGLSIKCEGSSEDMYASLDLALDKLERQVRRYKDKLRRHKPAEGRDRLFELTVLRPQVAEEPADDQDTTAAETETETLVAEAAPAESTEAQRKHHQAEQVHVLKREVMTARPLSIDDAIMQLDLESRAFLVFTNRDTGKLNVIYRRSDDDFGLIEPSSEDSALTRQTSERAD